MMKEMIQKEDMKKKRMDRRDTDKGKQDGL